MGAVNEMDLTGARRQRFEDAVEKATAGMWDALAAAYPEVTTGDFGPGETMVIEQTIRAAAKLWLHYNQPDEGIAPTTSAAGEIVAARKAAAVERLTPWARIIDSLGTFPLGDLVREAADTYRNEVLAGRDFHPIADDAAADGLYQRTEHMIDETEGVADMVSVLVGLLGEYRAEKLLGAVEITFDQAESLGLDGTGRDGNERAPYTIGNLTDDERQQLLGE